MRYAVALNENGEAIASPESIRGQHLPAIFDARYLTEEQRYPSGWIKDAVAWGCAEHIDCDETYCGTTVVWAKAPHSQNIQIGPACFRLKPNGAHDERCLLNEAAILRAIPEVTKYNGQLRARVNFPLGNRRGVDYDNKWLSHQFADAIRRNAHRPSFSSMREMVDKFEKHFGTLERVPESLQIEYCGHSYDWHKIFSASDEYHGLMDEALKAVGDELSDPSLVVVKGENWTRSQSSNRMLECTTQWVRYKNGLCFGLKPVIVFNQGCFDNPPEIDDVLAIGGRTYLAPRDQQWLTGKAHRKNNNREIKIYFNIGDQRQITRLDPETYWRPSPEWTVKPTQLQLELSAAP